MDEDAILLTLILCMDLPTFTTNAGQWSNCLIFPDNISYWTDNLRMLALIKYVT